MSDELKMRYKFSVEVTNDSLILSLFDNVKEERYVLEIGPRRAADFFTNFFLDGIRKRNDVEVKVEALPERDLGRGICQVALFKDHGLFKCSTPTTGESRNLEVYPRGFALWLAKSLKFRPETDLEFEYFK